MVKKIYLLDVTNRDGVQTARISLAKLEKTLLNIYLKEMGIAQSEMGFPSVNHEANYLNANLELQELGLLKGIVLSGWCRAVVEDVKIAGELTKVKDFNLSIPTSEQMILSKLKGKMVEKEVVDSMINSVNLAKKQGAKTIGVNAEDASRTELKFLIEFAKEAKKAGADRLRYCDTLGYDDPQSIYKRIRKLAEEVGIDIELHCHNDLGLAVASTVMGTKAAIDGGVNAWVNTTILGIGERAGNADLFSCVLALKKASGLKDKYGPLVEGIDLTKTWKVSKYVSYAFGLPIPLNQVAVGANAFAHESGIHADGALKDRRNYELYDYEEIGRGEPEVIHTSRIITTGEYGGIKGFLSVYEKLGIQFKDSSEAREILKLCQYANLHTQKPLTNDELVFIAKYPEQASKIMTVEPQRG